PRGRQAGTVRWDGRSHDIAVVASVIEAARSGHRAPADALRMHRRRAAAGRLVLLVVDTSGSMGARDRLTRTRAALRSVLDRVYVSRDRVALQAFRAGRAELVVAPRRGVGAARAAIEALPTGGGTPVESALRGAARLLRRVQAERPGESSLLVLVTDGRTRDSVRAAATEVGALATQTMVLDTEAGATRLGRARQIAAWLGASYEAIG
ncbi:MAG: VWA domain-containing protein, partial [Dehalococcoidia bacterium]